MWQLCLWWESAPHSSHNSTSYLQSLSSKETHTTPLEMSLGAEKLISHGHETGGRALCSSLGLPCSVLRGHRAPQPVQSSVNEQDPSGVKGICCSNL